MSGSRTSNSFSKEPARREDALNRNNILGALALAAVIHAQQTAPASAPAPRLQLSAQADPHLRG